MDTFPSFTAFFALVLLLSQKATADNGRITASGTDNVRGIIGAIVDNSTRIGKEQKVAMEMAIEDVHDRTSQSYALRMKNSHGEPYRAALAARDLIDQQEVQALLSPQRWEETSLVAEIGNQANIPVLSIADSNPSWATERWPFLLQASPNQNSQMKAIAAIVQSWQWHQVTVIYEDIDSLRSGVMPHLSDALRDVGAEISHLLAISPFSSPSLSKELERLKHEQCRVFVVHLSLSLAMHLFERAKEMNMMEKEYVWITTDTTTGLVHSLNSATISSMQGTIGVKSYFPRKDANFQDFYTRFRRKFSSENPEEDNHEPGTFAVLAYDAVWTVCKAMSESSSSQQLLRKLTLSEFYGLSGKVQFVDRKVAPAHKFQVINVIGKSYQELGFWTDTSGFSATIDERAPYQPSMGSSLGQVFWPGGSLNTPRGWALPTDAKPLMIGVPTKSSFKKYVNVIHDSSKNTTHFEGFAIDLFNATVKILPFYLPYNLTPFDGTYDELVKQVHFKKFDAVVGDVAIVSKRYQHAEFTHPYTESGLVMIVPVRPQTSDRALLFMKPFTKAMWVLIGLINIYNGFVVWLIERKHCPELKGSGFNQVGALLSLAFTTLFSLHGEKLHSNLSRMAMVVWLFVALVLTQTYTANLTSILTVQRLEPTVTDVELLRNSNAMVGYCRGSFVADYLVDVLRIHRGNVRNYKSPEDYAQALRSREIAAAFLEVPLAKLFLAKYCKEFTIAGPTYKVGGFGFVFPRGSPLLPDVTKALLSVSESGKLRDLEISMIASQECEDIESIDDISSLNPSSFWVLFVLTAGTSTAALLVYVVCHRRFGQKTIRRLMLAVMRHWWHRKKSFSRRVSSNERSSNFPNTSNSRIQV
ncbi:glutamate receptor 2.8-like [Juglans microcarpa x Juglans regia]|uniref:glutamate receptor 2.8-like n=1 Tax=Juglans microcarpa x Juglans regia TaxID=2249226 RepID=UPI001B7E86F1|nr:glutamate receptor 2.8-like [Juglans microcarpa x Juglans regia]